MPKLIHRKLAIDNREEALVLGPRQCGFESLRRYQINSLPIVNCQFPIDGFRHRPLVKRVNWQWAIENRHAPARVMQSGRHRKLKSRPRRDSNPLASTNSNHARVAQLEEAADLRPAV